MNDMPAQDFDAMRMTAVMWIAVLAVVTLVGLFAPRLWVRKIAGVLAAGVALWMCVILLADIRAQGFDGTTALMWIGVVAVVTLVGLFAPRLWVRKTAVVLVAGIALCMYVIPLADIRPHIAEARSRGGPPGFVDGMIERERLLLRFHAITFFSASGLTLLALTSPRKKKAINAPLTPEEPPQQE